MKSNKLAPRKHAAQAIVEFAIVLPILLLLLYGLLEAGRLLFMYSTIVNASRQAVRYGSTTGMGTGTTTVKRYQDCVGIRQAAIKVDYLKAFNHNTTTNNDIQIWHDNGPNDPNPDQQICLAGDPSASWTPPNNDSRLIVKVTGHYNMIVKMVPFGSRPIESTSSRTILVSISVPASGSGSGGGTETPTITVTDNPAVSQAPNEVTVTVTVSGTAGTPQGTVDVFVDGVLVCDDVALSSGTGSCGIRFYATGNITAEFTPSDSVYESGTSDPEEHVVNPAPVTVTVTDEPPLSLPGTPVTVSALVRNNFDLTGTYVIPAGNVTFTNSEGNTCTDALDANGEASCSLVFTLANSTITAAYTSSNAIHQNGSGTTTHQVSIYTATATNTPPATATATATIPATSTPTATATLAPVTGCDYFRNYFRDLPASPNPLVISGTTMTVSIPNPNPYSVQVNDIFLVWNFDKGHTGPGTKEVRLLSAAMNGVTFWNVASPGIGGGNFTIPYPYSAPAVIPPGGTSLVFTFDNNYNNRSNTEKVTLGFSTPGCEVYSVTVPGGIPSATLKVQLKANGTDNNQQSAFAFKVINTGSSAVSRVSVRIYFTTDGTNPASNYVLEKYYDQSGVAAVSGPSLAFGSTYYFTINYGTTALSAVNGSNSWEFHTALHLSDWGSTYSSANDWWRSTGSLPGNYSDWTRIPAYVSGYLVWGSQP